jgi:hypothetical protein
MAVTTTTTAFSRCSIAWIRHSCSSIEGPRPVPALPVSRAVVLEGRQDRNATFQFDGVGAPLSWAMNNAQIEAIEDQWNERQRTAPRRTDGGALLFPPR